MNWWRKAAQPKRPANLRRGVERLDDRIVPDTTSVTVPTTNDTTSTTTTTTTPPTTNPPPTATSSTSTAEDGTITTTTTAPDGTVTVAIQSPDGTITTTVTNPDGTSNTTITPPPAPPPPATHVFAVGGDVGNMSRARLYDTVGNKLLDLQAFPNGDPRSGVRVAAGDMNGDGVVDLVAGAGPGYRPYLKVFDGLTGQQLTVFEAYDSRFRGGMNLAVGDINGDGRNDIVVGASDGGGSHVKVFDGAGLFPPGGIAALQVPPGPTNYLVREFFAYDAKYPVGARVAVADVNGDGRNDIVTAPGNLGGPHIRVFSGIDGAMFREWFAYDDLFRGGVFVAAGDMNGDGKAEVVTSMGNGGITQVNVFNGLDNRILRSFNADPSRPRVSTRVAVFDYDRDGDMDVVTSVLNQINSFDGRTFVHTGGMAAFDPGHVGGVFFG